MEVDDSYDVLFQDWTAENSMTIFPEVRKCLLESSSEREILRALEIYFNFCLSTITQVESEIFKKACLACKKIVEDRLKITEQNPTSCVERLGVSIQIISFFLKVFEVLSKNHKIITIEIGNFLIVTSEVVYCCLSHCKMCDQVYGTLLGSLAEHLRNFFKTSCDLLEHLLNFLTSLNEYDFDCHIDMFLEVMSFLSKSGIVLMSLEIKTMAKVWKAFTAIIENHSNLKKIFKIEETLKDLCCKITTNLEAILCEENQDFERMIKLNCFLLKVVIKLCNAYAGALKNCHEPLLNLLLLFCRWDTLVKTQPKFKTKEFHDLLNQLTSGTDPLLTELLNDKMFIEEFHEVGKNNKSVEFAVLCCIIMKKLTDCNLEMRSLWFNKNENILMLVFSAASSSEFISTTLSLPNIVVKGKQTKFTDLYEYVLVATCAFLVKATANEFHIIESILVKNILQRNPIKALLATDIWCFLARVAGSDLCLSQIFTLSKTLQKILETERVEKWYLMSLIRRLFLLLTESHKQSFLKNFPASFYFTLWEGCWFDGLTPKESSHVRECVLSQLEKSLNGNKENSKSEKCESRITELWKFNCDKIVSSAENERFMKILCGLTASVVSTLPPEEIFLILSQIKRLLATGQPTSIQLYFSKILKSLSLVFIPPRNFQREIIIAIADIFRILLSSKQVLAKQKAFETFYTFSHVTFHGEVVSLSVQDSPELRQEVTNYFKRIPSDDTAFNLNNYFSDLYRLKFEHVCSEVGVECKNIKLDSAELKTVVMRWKKDGKQIVDCFELLSKSEKLEIKSVCQSILQLPD